MLTGLARFVVVLALGIVVRAWRGIVPAPAPRMVPMIRCVSCWRQRQLGERCECGAWPGHA